MSFISFEYIIFLLFVVYIYFLILPRTWRASFLLITSYIFYGFWNVNYLILIIFSTAVDYSVARLMPSPDSNRNPRRNFLLFTSILVNLGVLFLFKYFNFFADSYNGLARLLEIKTATPMLDVLLPVGISFYTFQSMAYTIDIYRDKVSVEKNPIVFATYVTFFPQLVAGPIERAQKMLPQLHQLPDFDYARAVDGLRLILWGAFKKVAIGDRLAPYISTVYDNPEAYPGATLSLATFFFTIQIYCDFSGYSDIAIGSAKIFGIDLMDNFRQPYFASSIRDFWRRWHISLSTWFRDYVYIPLGGNRVSLVRNIINLIIVFVVSGLWHGAAWTFVIWGALHGLFMVGEMLFGKLTHSLSILPKFPLLQMVLTFVLVWFSWIFFRANSFDDALYIVRHISIIGNFDSLTLPIMDSENYVLATFNPNIELALMFGLIVLLGVYDWFDMRGGTIELIKRQRRSVRWTFYYAAVYVILFSLIVIDINEQFIYFQF